MKRTLRILAIVLLLVAVGWSAVWYLGRGQVEERLDLELARLGTAGWTVTTDDRSIGGFPFGYRVRLEKVAAINGKSGVLVQLPWLEADGGAGAPITLHLPETAEATIPVSEQLRRSDPNLPKTLKVTAHSQEMMVQMASSAEGAQSYAVNAGEAGLLIDEPSLGGRSLIALVGLDASVDVTPGAVSKFRLAAEETLIDRVTANGEQSAQITQDEVSLVGETDLTSLGGLYTAFYQGAEGRLEGALQTGRSTFSVSALAGEDQSDRLDLVAGSSTALITLDTGQIEFKGAGRANLWTLTPANPTTPYRGTMSLDTVETILSLPTAPSEDPAPSQLRLALTQVTADDTLWESLDPESKLERDPARLVLDLEGTVLVTQRLDQMLPGQAPPFEPANVSVKDFELSLFGARGTASGDLDVLQPISLPLGTLNVQFRGAEALIANLATTRLIDPQMAETAQAMLEVYTRPGESTEQRVTEIEFGTEGIEINGRPVP